MEFLEDTVKGFIIGILYLFITRENDTSFKNILIFVIFYISVSNGARVAGIDPNVVATAFVTKSVFTIVDQRIKVYKNNKQDEKITNK